MGWVAALALAGAGLAARGYLTDAPLLFFPGLLALAVALGPVAFAVGHGTWPLGRLRLALAGASSVCFLLLAELLLRGVAWIHPDPPLRAFYTYADAVADPGGFLRWWARSGLAQLGDLVMPDPLGRNPYVLRPGTYARIDAAPPIHVNRLGFRGPELSREKGGRFRIVALGESTTFGMTYLPGDRPWPEVLEQRIARELACDRPVEVINAGVPGWTLANQVTRLPEDVLPLEPDLIVSYHGFNGFNFFFAQLPEVTLRSSPTPPPRPSRILARLETAARLAWFRRRYRAVPEIDANVSDEELERTPYAHFYRRLVELARPRGAEVALASFNMAVNAQSPEEVIRFYEALVPDLRARILANQLHTRLLRRLARELGATFIDASPGLDGAYREAYIDVAHFTGSGDERLAANVLAGILPALRDHPRLRCRSR